MLTGNGLARRVHVALITLLIIGVAGSFWMSMRARATAQDRAVEQAQVIADSSLTLVFRPDDLQHDASPERIRELSRSIDDVVLDPSDFNTVTLFSASGEILFSTEDGNIGQHLAGERQRIRMAFRGQPQSRLIDGTLSVLVGLRFPSGVGDTAAVELSRPADDIAAAAGPWRTNMFFLGGALALVLLAAGAPMRRGAETTDPAETGRMRVPVIPARQPATPARRIEAPRPGMKEEAEARRRAETRAQEAEQRVSLLQDQYRATLEELQSAQQLLRDQPEGRGREFEERAVKAEAAARSLEQRLHSVTVERDRIAGELLARRDAIAGPGRDVLKHAEAEAMGLRAELEGAQTQLSMTIQELGSLQRQAERSSELQEELDAAQLESLHARDAMEAMQGELRSARTELDDVRDELRALRNEEQRAAELTDELRTAKAELVSVRASHRAELVEREAELEEQVRSVREEFQAQVAEAEARHAAELAETEREFAARVAVAARGADEASARVAAAGADLEAARSESEARAVDLESARAELQAAHDRIEVLQQGLSERQGDFDDADEEVKRAQADREALATELTQLRATLQETEAGLAQERAEREALESSGSHAQDEARRATERADRVSEELEAAAQANTEMNRRLQEIEARRALEMAEDEGRAHMDELLMATQERLAGQSEKLIAAEERLRTMERQTTADAERLEELEAQLRQHQMAEQMRELQTSKHEHHDSADAAPVEDRRAATPFIKEMSMDAQKTISRMMGVAQLLKHTRGAKEQAQLVQQLTANGRRLGNTIRDLSDIDSLVTGSISLALRNTDLESLIRRVLEESGIESEQDVRVEIEPVSIAVDRTRTEQILQALLRSASDRTPAGKTITVRLIRDKGGAMIVVEDAESSSEISLSPMVRRLAEVQGGWAKVAPREGGGAAFQVFLPAGGPGGTPAPEPDGADRVAEEVEDDPNHWVKAEQALVRELRELSQGKAR
jgi:signal transduction histidine kinase